MAANHGISEAGVVPPTAGTEQMKSPDKRKHGLDLVGRLGREW